MLREITDDDLVTIQSWWMGHHNQSSPILYSSNKGWIVENVVCAFFYETNSTECYLEYCVSNPNTTSEQRHEGMKMIINVAEKYAKENNYRRIFVIADKKSVIDTMVKNNFRIVKENMTILERGL
jgi:hypothetical protein